MVTRDDVGHTICTREVVATELGTEPPRCVQCRASFDEAVVRRMSRTNSKCLGSRALDVIG